MITLLNSPVLTSCGTFCLCPVSLDAVRTALRAERWQSAIGHDSTAQVISSALGITVPSRRIEYRQDIGERAIVCCLRRQLSEGTVIGATDIGWIGFDWLLLTRLA